MIDLRWILPLLLLELAMPALSLNPVTTQPVTTRASLRLSPRLSPPALTKEPTSPPFTFAQPGPVYSIDPYYTMKIGESLVYRDALNQALAYYQPVFRLGKRSGTPMAALAEAKAGDLDGFLLRYQNFENDAMPIKWGSIECIISAAQPEGVSLEVVQRTWPDIRTLQPLPYRIDMQQARFVLPYPAQSVRFSRNPGNSGDGVNARWHYLATAATVKPEMLNATTEDDMLNAQEVRDFATMLTSDISDMPAFAPLIRLRVTYAGWTQAARFLSPLRFTPVTRPTLKPLLNPATKFFAAGERATPASSVRIPIKPREVPATTPTVAPIIKLPPSALRVPRVIGTLKPRTDLRYAWSAQREFLVEMPVLYPRGKTANYDYYFLSNSGRLGGPYLTPAQLPDKPHRIEAPADYDGHWYASELADRTIVWVAPNAIGVQWEAGGSLRPSCRFTVTEGEVDTLNAHITYDLYPLHSQMRLERIAVEMKERTGRPVEFRPITDLIDLNSLALVPDTPLMTRLLAERAVVMTVLKPSLLNAPWFRLTVDLPVTNWVDFTELLRSGALGRWRCALREDLMGGGERDTLEFTLQGNLIDAAGGPVTATCDSVDSVTGGLKVTLHNYGLAAQVVRALRLRMSGTEETVIDYEMEGAGVRMPGLTEASSFDGGDGTAGSMTRTLDIPSTDVVKSLLGSGKYSQMTAVLLPEAVLDDAATPSLDADILFGYVRSLCYQYVGASEVVNLPVAPAEPGQWAGYRSGEIVVRYHGFLYRTPLDLTKRNTIAIRRLPREGVYAWNGDPTAVNSLEYRAYFVKNDGTPLVLPPQPPDNPKWGTADIAGIILNMP